MTAFWGYPTASWLPILLTQIGSQVKRRQSQSYKFKEFLKISNFLILKQTLHATHILKLLDKMQIWNGSDEYYWRYRTDTILSTDGQTDKVKPVYPPFNLVEAEGIITYLSYLIRVKCHWCLFLRVLPLYVGWSTSWSLTPLISRFMGPIFGPIWGRQDPGGPMCAPWTLLSGTLRPRRNCLHFADGFSNAFSWRKICEFCLGCHWSLFQRFLLTILQHWYR